HLHDKTRSKRRAVLRRRYSLFVFLPRFVFVSRAFSQSKRLSPTIKRFSPGRQWTSATFTTASCRWVEATSRSSSSRTANFKTSMASTPCRVVRRDHCTAQGVSDQERRAPVRRQSSEGALSGR